ncbi:MAG: hypothetical protein OXE56_06760 [Gammaproteobacteria bacterium]|nr:hypothetical protein [Gammaproteobacteria bacterium]
MSETGPFSYHNDVLSGVHVISDRKNLHPYCLSDAEVDFHIGQLKRYLDQVSVEMKRAIRERKGEAILP